MEQETLSKIFAGLSSISKEAQTAACGLYDDLCVSLPKDNISVDGGFVYHVNPNKNSQHINTLKAGNCALLNGKLPKNNGIVLGADHAGLQCSHHSCTYDVCPAALAACFVAFRENDALSDIPIYDATKEKARRIERAAKVFRDKWTERLIDSDVALNLLCSPSENDFSGMIVVEDDSYKEEFIEDFSKLLVTLEKIDKGAIERMHMADLVSEVDSSGTKFKKSKGENLCLRKLYVFDRLKDFVDQDGGLFGSTSAKNYIIERFGHLVENQYVVLVGTEAETADFCAQNSRFQFTFDQHRFVLVGIDQDKLYQMYLDNLEANLREQAVSSKTFEREFKQFVSFNGDWLPFKGRELADFLAKHANAQQKLVLPKSRYQSSSLDEMLDSVIGLPQVKDTIRQLEQYAIFRKMAAGSGRDLPPSNMHMLFMGNPGTGKTTVARIISTMLFKIGIIRKNKCVEVSSKDLIAPYVGQTDKKTHDVVTSALGGILFIDEAYSLSMGGESNAGSFGKEAIAELVKCMEDYKNDLIVIFAGYEKEMNEFLETNPGLSSRIGYTFRFQDYSTDELIKLFHLKVKRAGFTTDTKNVDRELHTMFEAHRRFKNFGNGRFVENVVQKALIKHSEHQSKSDYENDYELTVADLPTRQELYNITDWVPKPAAELLAPLVGMKDLKAKICEFEQVVQYYEGARKADLKLPQFNMHMIFTGNPGTGKTTVARIIGSILYNVGAVPTNKFIEIEAKDLTAFQFNSSQSATEKYLKDAMGGVMFIDEAYSLLYTNEGNEIIAQLVKAMEDHKGEFCIMFAGYKNEMREFIDRNPGLASRIGYTFHFDDYETEELQEIFDIKTSKAGLKIGVGVRTETTKIFKYFHSVESFGNGRFVDKLVQEILARHASRTDVNRCDIEQLSEITVEDVPSIEDMCKIVSMPVYDPSDVSDEEARKRVAIHEMGHAICRLALTGGTDIIVVTIEQEGNGALGYVQHKGAVTALPTSDHFFDQITEYMGGMAAEQYHFGAYSAGNSADLQSATRIAANCVATYGMTDAGYVQYLSSSSAEFKPAQLPAEVQAAMNDLMKKAFERAKQVIDDNKDVYYKMVDVLLEESTISGERIEKIWQDLNKKAKGE